MEISHNQTHSIEKERRARELWEHTTLTEVEAFVYVARTTSPAWSHSQISDSIDINESASQSHFSCAKKKAREAKATHKLINEGKMGPIKGPPGPNPDSPENLTVDEILYNISSCDHWIEMGLVSVNGVNLKDQKERAVSELADNQESEFVRTRAIACDLETVLQNIHVEGVPSVESNN